MAKDNTVLKAVGIGALALTLFAFKKKSDYSKVLEEMTIDIDQIRNFRISKGKAYVDLDIALHNPTNYDFDPYTAGLIKVKQIKLFHNKKEIGNAFHDLYEIDLPAKSNFLITNVKLELLALDIIGLFLDGKLDSDVNNYQVHIYVEALGKTWVIEQ